MPKTIVITGASSGIGEALALRYAAAGTKLGLTGRSEVRLARVAERCRERGSEVSAAVLDVRARQEMEAWLEEFDAGSAVDLLIANAGIMEGRSAPDEVETAEASLSLMETNVIGVLNAIHPLMPRMMARGRGQIAIVSSIAAFIPLPDAPSYGASKAAVLSYGLALRDLLDRYGIRISVICPGYVKTPMMDQESGIKPGAMEAPAAAELIARGLERNRAVITFPFWFSLMTRLGGLLPDRLRRRSMDPYRFTVAPRQPGN
jgi:short-subunit dehydrogenase